MTSDVYLTLTGDATASSKKRLNFYFHNGVHQLLGERIKVGRFKNRLILMQDDNGYKISKQNKDNTSGILQMTWGESLDFFKPFLDTDYELKFDDLYEYYYIEKEFKKEN